MSPAQMVWFDSGPLFQKSLATAYRKIVGLGESPANAGSATRDEDCITGSLHGDMQRLTAKNAFLPALLLLSPSCSRLRSPPSALDR